MISKARSCVSGNMALDIQSENALTTRTKLTNTQHIKWMKTNDTYVTKVLVQSLSSWRFQTHVFTVFAVHCNSIPLIQIRSCHSTHRRLKQAHVFVWFVYVAD